MHLMCDFVSENNAPLAQTRLLPDDKCKGGLLCTHEHPARHATVTTCNLSFGAVPSQSTTPDYPTMMRATNRVGM